MEKIISFSIVFVEVFMEKFVQTSI